MKTVEALISCMVLLSFSSIFLLQAPHANSSALQQYRLAEDVWRIAYLKGCFNQSVPVGAVLEDAEGVAMGLSAGDAASFAAEASSFAAGGTYAEMEDCLNAKVIPQVEYETGLPVSFENIQAAGELSKGTAITKTVIVGGIPQKVTLRVG
ncbi:MAG: hypothetical protein QXH30_02175 [Candidatus Bilamarchaeaceae archaeon]